MKRLILVLPACLLLSCSSPSSKKSAPKPGTMAPVSTAKVKLRPYRVRDLKNGLRIYFVRDETLPRTSFQLLLKSGGRQEPSDLEGLNSFVAGLLDQGSTKRNAEKLAEDFNSLGTEFSASPGSDATVFSASTLSPEAERLLDLFAEVVMHPEFAEKEISRLRSQSLSALKRRMDNPAGFASREYQNYLFGPHPYGRDNLGSEKSLNRIARVDVLRHYLTWYRPNNAILAVTGRYGPDFENRVADVFSAWPQRELKDSVPSKPPAVERLTMRLISKPSLVQTQLRFGFIGIPRTHKDYLTLRLASEALGGGFGSRLMQRIRDDLGLTYSVSSGLDARLVGGSFTISTFTKNDSVGKTVDEVLRVYKDFAEKGITEEELATAKAQLIGQYPRSLETADSVAAQLMTIDFYGLPLSELTNYPKLVDRVSLKDINAAIRTHFPKEALKILVYGDGRSLKSQLTPWNPEVVPASR